MSVGTGLLAVLIFHAAETITRPQGTAQFMAIELLTYNDARMTNAEDQFDVTHSPHHDLESFVWVLLYAVMIKVRLALARF